MVNVHVIVAYQGLEYIATLNLGKVLDNAIVVYRNEDFVNVVFSDIGNAVSETFFTTSDQIETGSIGMDSLDKVFLKVAVVFMGDR